MKKDLVSVVLITRNRKKEALKAVGSIYRQTYKRLEVILVDNASLDDTAKIIKKKYPKTKIITCQINRGAAGGRNLGLKLTKGELLLFMDDDACADRHMVSELVKAVKQDPRIGIVQPKIYDMDRANIIQGLGHDINLLTGRVSGIGVGEEDCGQYEKSADITMVGCTWLVKREVFTKIGNYDEDFFIPYEDSDFSLRARRAGFRVCLAPQALVWHSSHVGSDIPPKLVWIGITTPDRAFRISCNKLIFMKKHASNFHLIIFLFVFTPIYTILHSVIIFSSGRFDILINYWKGLMAGLFYVLSKNR